MTRREFTAKRAISALALAAAALVAPAVWAAGVPAASATGDCVVNSTPGSTSLSCEPTEVSPGGAPSEKALTYSNDDNAGPFGPAGPAVPGR